MALAHELHALMMACAVGGRPLSELRSWLEDHVDDVVESDDERLNELDGLAWTLLSELDRGDRSEDAVREELKGVASARSAGMVVAATPSTSTRETTAS